MLSAEESNTILYDQTANPQPSVVINLDNLYKYVYKCTDTD